MTPVSVLTLGTRNPHKVKEIERLLAAAGIAVQPLPDGVDLPPEDGLTFAENALPKARVAAEATGGPAIADDSGIEAQALDGGPGVRSARYAGPGASDEDNLAKLVAQVPAGDRLKYVCALAFVDGETGEERLFTGECTGTMAPEPRGTRGFGYDPVFLPDGDWQGRTMAELSDAEKDEISHRGLAVRRLIDWITR
jgi:XTP/dITP diphosphohydrolase